MRAGPGGGQAETQAVQAFALMLQALGRRHQLRGGAVQPLGGALQAPLLPAGHGLGRLHDAAQQFRARHASQFGGGRRRGCAHVGHEIGDGEIRFVSDAADDGNLAGRDFAGQRLVVETPKILDAAAAADQQQRVDLGALVGDAHLGRQPSGGIRPLYRRGIDDHGHLGRTPRQCRQHVPQRRGMQGRNDPDGARQAHGLALAGRIEQAFRGQLLLQPQERFIQIADAGPAHGVGLQLVVAAGLVKGNAGADLDLVARPRHETDRAGAASEHDGAHGGPAVLEREIPMPGSRRCEVGNLPAHPQRRDAALQQLPHGLIQLGNRQDIPRKCVVCDCRFNCHGAFRWVPVHRARLAGRNHTASQHICRNRPDSQQNRINLLIFMGF
ncbi:hypothetical protein LMG26858_04880 [Achromobacter anxifer]|uniref:Uncharacterized protein n=1 Tax=Achromobacter anxifer TaxID=1287737 RepID=A0A6S7EMY6_9BURK|nr:hypothetical protein LMG26858_04880 [Achromobacter anxifer]